MKPLLPVGTPILDMNSPTFAECFMEACGLQPGDKVEISTPQFNHVDGLSVPVPLDGVDLSRLHKTDPETLKALGFGIWEKTKKGTHWLFPKEWHEHIPDGFLVTDIFGEQKAFKRGETDDNYRFGCLSFGFIQQEQL